MCWVSEEMKESKRDLASENLLYLKRVGRRVRREERESLDEGGVEFATMFVFMFFFDEGLLKG